MQPEKPAFNIYKSGDYNDAQFYTVACACMDPDHQHTFLIERDSVTNLISVSLYIQVQTPWWLWKSKIKAIWSILTKGQIQYQSTLVMDKQQALNYGSALIESVQELEAKAAK